MDDIRQKLLSVFLHEVQGKLPAIESFLMARDSKNCDLSALDDAFRAIHTLKGTAGLLKADSIRTIAFRVENILEKHLLKKTCPTPVEYDALNLAQKQMCDLIDCLELDQPESPGLMAGVMRALDLAEAFPGQPSFMSERAEVLLAEDPFADDSIFDYVEEGHDGEDFSARLMAEPSVETKFVVGPVDVDLPDDPFADDQQFGLSDSTGGAVYQKLESPYFDPFAEDPDFEPTAPKLSEGTTDFSQAPDSFFYDKSEAKSRQNFTCCSFKLATKQYSLPIENMVEISDLPQVVDLPLSPAYIYGMANLRGKVLPVVDIAGCDGEPSTHAVNRRMVVVEAQGEEFAFLCDGVPSLNVEFSGEKIDPVDFMTRYRIRTP